MLSFLACLLAAETSSDKAGQVVSPFNDPNQQLEQHHQGSTDSAAMAPLPKAETAEQGPLESSFADISVADANDASRAGSNGKTEALTSTQTGGSGASKAAAITNQDLQEAAATADSGQKSISLKLRKPPKLWVPDAATKGSPEHESQHESSAAADSGAARSEGNAKIPLWHQSESTVWTEIQDVAVRMIMPLHCCFAWFQSSGPDDESLTQLLVVLQRLLHDLLMGHFGDHDLDFSRVLSAGLYPVLRCANLASAESPLVTSLLVAFLQRTALGVQDLDAMEDYERAPDGVPSSHEVSEIWQLFGKHWAVIDPAS